MRLRQLLMTAPAQCMELLDGGRLQKAGTNVLGESRVLDSLPNSMQVPREGW